MPSERDYKEPNEVLIPGVGLFMTMGASLSGFIAWAFPVALLSGFGMGSNWTMVELALSGVLVYHGASMLMRGRIAEVEALSSACMPDSTISTGTGGTRGGSPRMST